jgi:hypothetical protein
MIYTLEDYLVQLHTGQWFGFKDFNGDESNKTYANIIIHSSDIKPTEQECIDGVALMQAEYDNSQYARDRASAYPPVTDYLDGIVKGDTAQVDKYIADCQAVKDAHPKETI